jgi:hypothetical protein
LVDLPEISDFYDPELRRATEQINRLFQALAERRPPGMEPSVIIVEGRPLLAWTQPSSDGPNEDGAIGPDDDPDTIRRALRLKSEKPAHKRSWVIIVRKIWCYASPAGDCVVAKFWDTLDVVARSFHDPDLAGATMQVNAILDKLREAKDPRSELSFILVENALLLVRTEPAIGPGAEPHVIRQALGMKDNSDQPSMWWAGEWWDRGTYSAGAVVRYQGGAYTCVNPVDEGPNDPPPADINHWEAIIPARD